jgi:hypothetical protein
MFEKHHQAMAAAKPEAMEWLQENHKKLWPKPTHGFFMHPPLLKSTAGGRMKKMKSALEGGSNRKKLGTEGGASKR